MGPEGVHTRDKVEGVSRFGNDFKKKTDGGIAALLIPPLDLISQGLGL